MPARWRKRTNWCERSNRPAAVRSPFRQTNADPAAVKNAVDVTLNSFGGLDILVNKSEIHIGEIHQVQHLAADAKYLAELGNAVLHPAGSRSLSAHSSKSALILPIVA